MNRRLIRLFLFGAALLAVAPFDDADAQARRRSVPSSTRRAAGTPSARWAGQSGQDFAGKASTLGGNGIQDVRIDISGIPVGQLSSIILRGHGGGEWQWAPDGKPPAGWAIHMNADPARNEAQLFFEPGAEETGRQFELKWTVPGQPEGSLYFPGGKFDPTMPVASARIAARWIGQEPGKPVDLTNPSPSVGPDGVEDVVIELAGISERDEVTAVDVRTGDDKFRWAFGVNPKGAWNAELIREPKNSPKARLVLALPTVSQGTISGRDLEIRLKYGSEAVTQANLAAGAAVADRLMPAAKLPKVIASKIEARWVGPVARSKAGPGAVRLELSGLAKDPRIQSALLTDDSGAVYATANAKSEVPFQPLLVERSGTDRALLEFLPGRELEAETLSLRINYADGAMAFLTLQGGSTELERRVPPIASGRTQVSPGQDLQAAVNRGGTVILADGEHDLRNTLTLDRPVRIEAAPNARPVLSFSGGTGQPWRAAIKIRTGGVRLSGFSIRFDGQIAWKDDVAYGPAVIATTDPEDKGFDHDAAHWGIVLEKLDIVGPQQSGGSAAQPPEAVKLAKVLNGALGRIEGCILRGGTVQLAGGPWAIVGNRHDGPLPGTFSYDAFAVTRPRDLEVLSNRVDPVRGSGKLWRFLNLTQHGTDIRVEGNIVRQTGPRKDDSIGDMNANEILLTESYRMKFEGVASAVSSDGRVVVLPDSPGGPPAPGDALAILAGPEAGGFVAVRQNLGDGAILVDPPLGAATRNDPVISVATGFRETSFVSNSIDATGSDNAFNLCLAGNHFGTVITDNELIGGGESLRLSAYPTESPNVWGWTHAPMLRLSITRNRIAQAAKPARLSTDHGPAIKTSSGRTYFTADVSGNRFAPSQEGPAVRLGDPGGLDTAGTVITWNSNEGQPDAAEVEVISARVNGREQAGQRMPVRGSGR